ncbi:MAG: Tex family protein [Prevotella sp.]|nr:RNA-binding transcriptional accessory protein [Bacteroidales bacterium]MDY4230405.1 Tex family protein [Prevotella sp.]
MNPFTSHITTVLQLPSRQVEATLDLLAEGCTIPFIARYRKERTGGLDEVQIAAISDLNNKLSELQKRKETILRTIGEQGKLTEALRQSIERSWDATEIEDIYLPFKPRRRTRAQVAREKGLEPLATLIMLQREQDPRTAAQRFVGHGVATAEEALQGAKDIIAEQVSEDSQARQKVRAVYRREAVIESHVVKKKAAEEAAQKYSDYFDFSEELRRCSSHRLLAMRRGEAEGFLKVGITADDEECQSRLLRQFVRGRGPCQQLMEEAVTDGYSRLIRPSMENEFAALSKEKADDEAIRVFRENLRQLLLAAPLGQKRVMGVDPGIRTGCKVVVLDAQGALLYHTVVFAVGDKASEPLRRFSETARRFGVEAIAVGNGTASRETTDILRQIKDIPTYVVSEDGASIYSASEAAREEFPDEDVTVRGAVSIGRRLMDPLAELVKIDPKSIGVGQYQHDVDQGKLKHSLDQTVELCVNSVGVNVNTASRQLLTYVSGLGPSLAQNIIDYRTANGAFSSRAQLKKVPRLGPAAFTQCAGFLRIPGAKNPLDASAVHPESYKIVERMAADCGCTVAELMGDGNRRKQIDLNRYVSESVGLPTLRDIMQELEKPGRDPRGKVEAFEFDPSVRTVDDLREGMELPGIVTNITNFGAFVDIGVHNDGLVHISQLSDHFIRDANEAVHLHQHVRVRVVEVDHRRHRVSLSMRGVSQAGS